MEVEISIIHSVPYGGISLNWTSITGSDGILKELFQKETRLHGILMEISRNCILITSDFDFKLNTSI